MEKIHRSLHDNKLSSEVSPAFMRAGGIIPIQVRKQRRLMQAYRNVVGSRFLADEAVQLQQGNFITKTIAYIRGDILLTTAFFATSIFFLYLVLLLALTINKLPPYLPLFYSLPWGEGQLIATPFFTLLPIAAVVVFFINTTLSMVIEKSQPILSRLVFLTTVLFSLLLVITTTKIIFLMIR